ncbi:MAG TPA: hypothetical protein VMV86_05755 [Methanosarcinales archaeon]|nr:hypothetical protein [Methanosarcinales archaeon]
MKEFARTLDIFTSGLRSYHKAVDRFQLYELFNFKASDFGLVPIHPVSSLLSSATLDSAGLLDEAHPFPQTFVGGKYTIVAAADRIFMASRLDPDILVPLDIYDILDPTTEKSITVGNCWSFADFWDTWFLTNGKTTVFACGKDWIEGKTTKVYAADATPVRTAVSHKGRVLFGGFDPSNFWSATSNTFFSTWYNKEYDTGFDPYVTIDGEDRLMPINENFVWWSSIGGGDALLLFLPSTVLEDGFLTSTYGATKPIFFDMLRQNMMGMAPMPFQGQVKELLALGDYILAFSEVGVASMKPVSSPEPTYGIVNLQIGGIISKGAVAGNDRFCLYVDNSGALVMIGADMKHTVLGYREFFYNMIGTDVLVSFVPTPYTNSSFGMFYITNGTYSYCYDDKGLHETWQVVKSAHYLNGAIVGSCDLSEDVADDEGRIGVDLGDLNEPGIKSIEWVEVDFEEIKHETTYTPTLQVAIEYRYNRASDGGWTSSAWKTVNKEGIVFFPISGVYFRLKIKVAKYGNFNFTNGSIGIKAGDKRFKRYFQISPSNAGPNTG